MSGLRWGATSDTGRMRPVNQDSLLAELPLFAVADGMGGHAAGEVASQLALVVVRLHLGPGRRPHLDDLVDAVTSANRALFEQARERPELRGMGTTFCALSLLAEEPGAPERLGVVNVGDSRGYVLRADDFRQLTRDHSYVEDLIEAGEITPLEARTHPQRHIVTRALGVEPHVFVDTWERPAIVGERYLLCSDGLTNELDDGEIEAVLRANPDPQDAADRLVHSANERGARDNVSVLVVDVVDGGFGGRIEVPAPPDGMRLDSVAGLGRAETLPPPAAANGTGAAPLTASGMAAAPQAPDAVAPARARRARRVARPPRVRTIIRNALFVAVLAAIAVVVFTSVRAYGRAGWYMTLHNDQVTLYQGREKGVLWVEPVARRTYPATRSQLTQDWRDKLDAHIPFTSRAAAELWFTLLYANPDAVNRGTTTTTSTAATTTTTVAATTTAAVPLPTTALAPPTAPPALTEAPTTTGGA